MSMIGNFGLCPKNSYENLISLILSNQLDAANELITKIHDGLLNTASTLENDRCSGEIFIALFHYLETEFEIDIRGNTELKKLSESWREVTGDYDMVSFTEKEKVQLLSLTDKIDYNTITQFINDFFQQDYGTAGQIACDVLIENLKRLGTDDVLIWHLF